MEHVGDGEGDEDEAQEQNGIERTVGEVHLVYQPHGKSAESITRNTAHRELHKQVLEQKAHIETATAGDNLYECYGEHVCHGVVTTALQFQHGLEVLLQVHPLRTEQVEHGCRVGRGHGGGQQEAGEHGHLYVHVGISREPEDETAREQCGEQDAHGGEYHTLCHDGLDVAQLGVHTTGEQDDAQGYHAYKLGILGTIKLKAKAICSETHAHEQEEQQGGDTETVASLADHNGAEYQYGAYQQDVSSIKYHNVLVDFSE